MNRFFILTAAFLYYLIWLILPIFELDEALILFPLPSIYAVYIPIFLLLLGFALVGSYLGYLLIKA
ncbi:hypothetical protein Kpol_1032p91 [Vanderwaltozyma polyspora DSM 70294]|uniref:Dolichol phosphate-mannose biosynthesis regulatory protein n=1 Tax=Vanderwaltozyma polyspora (strain ATCC 22028 / DSM 70294 / BCRC 21397 / CBS 2163 / NBRC 10782 / NRRL Y-8283 / UCD 57-17) TaxID=436907 RepID=A7TH42_VANPO|nr:uncharacterized protein Kpol_1032p91 [Vanderwaltozyma polyspora DSM 70294]EDO18494.1 hypothetical protein Kpol_1032p91 [Vanderwaltozyma polyspora DSM 70294]